MYNNDLTANNKKFQANYQNNKYGFLIDGNFYEIGGGGMPNLNYGSPLHTFNTAGSYTATKTCYLYGSVDSNASANTVEINNTTVFVAYAGQYFGDKLFTTTKLNVGDVVSVSSASPHLHVLEEI